MASNHQLITHDKRDDDDDMIISTPPLPPPTTICHAVPCHISYSGPSSGIDVLFQPTTIIHHPMITKNLNHTTTESTAVDQTNATSHGTNNVESSSSSSNYVIQAATIRGRGLLAKVPIIPHLEQPDKMNTNSGSTTTTTTTATTNISNGVHGHVYELIDHEATCYNNSRNNNDHYYESNQSQQSIKRKQLISKISFQQYIQWHHDHIISNILTVNESSTSTSTQQYHRAHEWMTIADILHTPLPIPPK